MKAEEIDKAICQLGVLLSDEMTGLIVTTMKQDFYEKYKKFDLITAWDCFVDEINRVNDVIQLHDELCKYTKEDWKMFEQYEQIQKLQEENRELRQSVEYWQKKYEEGTETFQID